MTRKPSYNLEEWQVRAALDGRLKAIVVPMKVQPLILKCGECFYPSGSDPKHKHYATEEHFRKGVAEDFAPYLPGDVIAGKEAYTLLAHKNIYRSPDDQVFYRCGSEDYGAWRRWKPAQTMPRWACRIFGTVKDVRPVRVHSLDSADSKSMGLIDLASPGEVWPRHMMLMLKEIWQSRHGKKYPWESNPWAWHYTLDVEVKR